MGKQVVLVIGEVGDWSADAVAAAAAARGCSPAGQPSQPISAFRLAERLRQLGLRSGQARSAALFQLATELPAALLARLLGIHVSVAVAWQRASGGDWTSYAAHLARRGVTTNTEQT